MSYKRIKYTPWQNVEAAMKEIVVEHVKYYDSPLVFVTDNTAIFDFRTMLERLREDIDKNRKYYGDISLDTLEDILHMYKRVDKMGTWSDKLKIMDTVIDDKKVSVYLGGIFDNNIDHPTIKGLFTKFIDIINDVTFYGPEIRDVFDKLISLPPSNTKAVYDAYIASKATSYESPEEWIHAIAADKFKDFITAGIFDAFPKIDNYLDEFSKEKVGPLESPYVNLRTIVDILSDYGFPVGYFMTCETFHKIYNVTNADVLHNPYGLCHAYHVNKQCVLDIIHNLNETLYLINNGKDKSGWFNLDLRMKMLRFYGIRFWVKDNSIVINRVNMKSQELDWGGNNISDYKNCISKSFQLLLDIYSVQGLLFMALETHSNGQCALTELDENAFLLLMKLYSKYVIYASEPHFESALGRYPLDRRKFGLIPILFECFRKYYNNGVRAFRNLSYVIHPIDLAHQFRRAYKDAKDYDRERELDKISNAFSIEGTTIKLKKSSVVTDNISAIKDYKLLSAFLFFGCCEHRESKVSNNMLIPNEFCIYELIRLRSEIESTNLSAISHIVNIETNACDTIRDTLYDAVNSDATFRNALYSMTSYVPAYHMNAKNGKLLPASEPEVIAFLAYLSGIKYNTTVEDYDSPSEE